MKNTTNINKNNNLQEEGNINVHGARVHNLKNIDVTIPRNKLTVITGLSGSGKSSLAFDTIYAEGQRRYLETFSAYARQFLGGMERPDIDKITGLSPVISIEQKTTNKNPRSTVGTVTEIYDYIRLLFARAGTAYSHVTGKPMVKYTDKQIIELIKEKYEDKKIVILAPVVQARKGHYRELFEQIVKKGFLYARVDGEIKEIEHRMMLDRYKIHNIEIVIDKISVNTASDKRLDDAIQLAMKHGKGLLMVNEKENDEVSFFSRNLMCPESGIAYNDPAPHTFSFNSPQGACTKCKGLGIINEIDIDKVIPNTKLSIYAGGILPLGKYKNSLIFWQIEAILDKVGLKLKTPIEDIPEEVLNSILYGTSEMLTIKSPAVGLSSKYVMNYEGIIKYIIAQKDNKTSGKARKWADQFHNIITCPDCKGGRLKKESLAFKIGDKNISELSELSIEELSNWFKEVKNTLSEKQILIATEIIKEITTRISFLLDVGLNYLTLNRSSATLSGGESQRIRLATQIGSKLVNVLYILDEPSIGLHQRDNVRLINSLKQLRDNNNTVIVVEHDKDMMFAADHIVDIGPHAGRLGGEIMTSGNIEQVLENSSLTSQYLKGTKTIEIPAERRKGNDNKIVLKGCKGNNLKNVTVAFPLGVLTCVTGVSGSGKSTLVNGTLQPILSQKFYNSLKDPFEYKKIEGVEHIDKVVEVNQSPIGRTPRSNPATYTGVFTDIRALFEKLPESQIRGYKLGRFSFNVKGGRCETCKGAGYKTIEMNFLPDVTVKCDECYGKRYNRETLEVRFKGKSIGDVLDLTINQAVELFEGIPSIINKLKTLKEVGLGYITLGQPSTTLSGGEAQRIKLASELSKKDTGKTLYILDEPTTGLHFEDIKVLLEVINKIVNKGNTVIIIEHNLDVIKVADYIIDIGKEGGKGGGKVLCVGTPEEIVKHKTSYTAKYLKDELI